MKAVTFTINFDISEHRDAVRLAKWLAKKNTYTFSFERIMLETTETSRFVVSSCWAHNMKRLARKIATIEGSDKD